MLILKTGLREIKRSLMGARRNVTRCFSFPVRKLEGFVIIILVFSTLIWPFLYSFRNLFIFAFLDVVSIRIIVHDNLYFVYFMTKYYYYSDQAKIPEMMCRWELNILKFHKLSYQLFRLIIYFNLSNNRRQNHNNDSQTKSVNRNLIFHFPILPFAKIKIDLF